MRVDQDRTGIAAAGHVHPFHYHCAVEVRRIQWPVARRAGGPPRASAYSDIPYPIRCQCLVITRQVGLRSAPKNVLLLTVTQGLQRNIQACRKGWLPLPSDRRLYFGHLCATHVFTVRADCVIPATAPFFASSQGKREGKQNCCCHVMHGVSPARSF